MESAKSKIAYYNEMIAKNTKAFLQSKDVKDRKILTKQIETFRKLQMRFSTINSKEESKKQLSLFN